MKAVIPSAALLAFAIQCGPTPDSAVSKRRAELSTKLAEGRYVGVEHQHCSDSGDRTTTLKQFSVATAFRNKPLEMTLPHSSNASSVAVNIACTERSIERVCPGGTSHAQIVYVWRSPNPASALAIYKLISWGFIKHECYGTISVTRNP